MTASAVVTWLRMTNPVKAEDWGLGVTVGELRQSEEGRRILDEEVQPMMGVSFDNPTPNPKGKP